MEPTHIVIDGEYIQEIATTKAPEEKDFIKAGQYHSDDTWIDYQSWHKATDAYNEYKATLPKILRSDNGLWKVGQELTEGVDFEIYNVQDSHGHINRRYWHVNGPVAHPIRQEQPSTPIQGEEVSIIEGNRLMAEFMGENYVEFHGDIARCPIDGSPWDYNPVSRLNYVTDWSELMPVVEKIESLSTKYEVDMVKRDCIIWDLSTLEPVATIRNSETKIQAAWQAVVEFIKWYNKNQNS